MPVVAIIGAVAAIGIAVEVGTTLAIIAAVGATIGAVGAITNNKALMIAGGIIGAIGGIGALAQSAGIIGADAFSFGSSAAGAAGEAGASAAGGLSGIDAEIAQWSQYGADLGTTAGEGSATLGTATLDAAPTSGGASPIIDQSGAVQPVEASTSPTLAAAESPNVTPAGTVDSGVTLPPQGDGAGGTLGPVGNSADPNATTNGILNSSPMPSSAAPAAPSSPAPANPMDAGIPGSYAAAQKAVDAAGPVKIATTDPSAWTGIKDFLKNNGTLAAGIVQAGSSFIAGATNGLTPAQIAALNAQAEANQAAANLSRMQQANMAQPLPVASRAPPVTGAPVGLINTPPPRPNVTGAPA